MNSESKPPQQPHIISTSDLVDNYKIHRNISQEIIVTTEDKLRLCLVRYTRRMERRRGWLAPLGILLAFTLTLINSSFRDYGLQAEVWKAIFIIAAVLAFGWLIYAIKAAWFSVSEEDVIAELKKGAVETGT